jgi:hypothetical protein
MKGLALSCKDKRGPHSYYAYGLGIHSALPLPELVSTEARPDIVVHFGKAERPQTEIGGAARLVWGTAQEVHLVWRDVGAFVVRDGREIVVDPLPGVEERVLRLAILGPSLGVLLLQRGLPVFHASVVGLSSGAVAFLAPKGHGKSTMAAALHMRGHDLVADDIMVVDSDRDQLMARPGFPQFKLWPESAQAIGQDPESLPIVYPGLEKRARRLSNGFSQEPQPLQSIYVLGIGEEIEIVPLPPKDALLHILPHWYGAMFDGELLRVFGLGNHFRECTRLVDRVPIYLLKRPPSLDMLPDVAGAVEKHVLCESQPVRACAARLLGEHGIGYRH